MVKNPEEIGGNFEGDMILNDDQMNRLFYGGVTTRNGRIDTKYRWPKRDGIVTLLYKFNSDREYSKFT